MKIFRWQGVLAFALIGILVAGFLFLFLDGMIERGIEEEGSKAKVVVTIRFHKGRQS